MLGPPPSQLEEGRQGFATTGLNNVQAWVLYGSGRKTKDHESAMASLVANGIDGVLRKHAANKQGGHKPWWLGPMAWLCNIGALIIRRGFWGILYHNYTKEPQNGTGNPLGPYIVMQKPAFLHRWNSLEPASSRG